MPLIYNHDAGMNSDALSITTSRSKSLASKVRPSLVSLTCSFVGKIPRWGERSNASRRGNLSCLSVQSGLIPERLGIIPVARPPTVLGRGDYDEAQAAPFWQGHLDNPRFPHIHQPAF